MIWSDETSVILLHRRGGYRVWRQSDERFLRSCIRERWKGASEFMFWGCFSYDQKGPCHVWCPETAKEKEIAKEEIEALNEELEPILRQQWELESGLRRLGLRNPPGKGHNGVGPRKQASLRDLREEESIGTAIRRRF